MGQVWKVMKWVLGIGLLLLLIGGGAAAFLGPKIMEAVAQRKQSQGGTLVQIEEAAHNSLTRIVSAPGIVESKEQVNITSRVSAEIDEIPYEEGDEVKKGDVIVRLNARDLEAALAAAEARMLADEANLKAAQASLAAEQASIVGTRASLTKAVADWERQQELFQSGDISQAELDAVRAEMDLMQATYEARTAGLDGAKANVEAARARIEVARADVAQARENLEYATIRSPMEGVITRIPLREGEVALGTNFNAGAVIMTIADLSEMIVRARIAEVDVARVKVGQKTKVSINGYGDREFDGTLRKLALQSQISSDGTSAFDAEIVLHLEPGERIFTGLTANVDVEVETLDSIVVIPSQAVLDKRTEDLPREVRESNTLVDANRTFVRVIYTVNGEGKANIRPVRVAASNLLRTAIAEGIEPGERVIVGPYRALQGLSDGQSVRNEDDEKKAKEGEEPSGDESEKATDEETQVADSGDTETTTTSDDDDETEDSGASTAEAG